MLTKLSATRMCVVCAMRSEYIQDEYMQVFVVDVHYVRLDREGPATAFTGSWALELVSV